MCRAIGNPAAVATAKSTNAGTYGAGLAPFFLSLSAWIGAYALFLILRPLSRRAITAVRQPIRIALAGKVVQDGHKRPYLPATVAVGYE
ncbi:MAG: hypothetical protein INR65_02265 [Gluconacetobacter diazotrophicus]|nr:hypothetical protein [Gluconacetobacter diazotrophicus]